MKKTFFVLAALLSCTAAYAQSDPCQFGVKIAVPISQATPTTLFSGAAARKNYICSFLVVSPDAEKIALVEAPTGSTCVSTPLALIGPVKAASGLSLTTNSVLAFGNGSGTIAAGANVQQDVCLLQSGTGLVGGVVVYTQQ